ncbi:MAG: hypothetical protein K9G65_00105 [Rickettsiaceae bacterium]|nr:hypothetical protein [Rickettsiaceae bacterium]
MINQIIQSKLFIASKLINVKEMCALISQGANPFTLDEDGKSAISYVSGIISTPERKELAQHIARFLFLYNNKMDDVENINLMALTSP